uniref:Putative ovule protein n=1 Tax=Solanum chacoense TaxID=4108 RepID=A0A0V0GEY9_SOLCH
MYLVDNHILLDSLYLLYEEFPLYTLSSLHTPRLQALATSHQPKYRITLSTKAWTYRKKSHGVFASARN